MLAIIGLGNLGKEYESTPHNAGFEALDYFAEKNNFPVFEFDKYSNSLVSEKDGLILVKPQTFMNSSGSSVQKLFKNLKLKIKNLALVHDDIDLPLGEFKISKNRGSAGHKGVESIIKALGTEDFTRIRIGVSKKKKPDVLKKFGKKDREILKSVFEQISSELGKMNFL